MDEKGLAVRKWPESRARSSEIYRTRPTPSASDKINFGRSASEGIPDSQPPGDHFLKAGESTIGDFDFGWMRLLQDLRLRTVE